MARPRSPQPTDGELEILKQLWEQGPASLAEICQGLRRGRPVATTTVATMLRVMLDKGLVTRRKGARGFEWAARRSRRSTARGLLGQLLDRAFDGSASSLVSHLLEEGALSEEDREEIRRLLDAHEKTAKKGKGREGR